jgi:hypothetical protein
MLDIFLEKSRRRRAARARKHIVGPIDADNGPGKAIARSWVLFPGPQLRSKTSSSRIRDAREEVSAARALFLEFQIEF